MKTNETNKQLGTKERISTLWIVVMFTMIFADILTIFTPGVLKQIIEGTTDVKMTKELLLVFAVLLEIPIIMIFLSRVLQYRLNRWMNIIASVITILFVIGGGSLYLHYIFFASIEVICMLMIIRYSLKWKEQEDSIEENQ